MRSPTDLLISDHLHRLVGKCQAPIRFGNLLHPVFSGNGRGPFEEIPCGSKRARSTNLNMRYMD